VTEYDPSALQMAQAPGQRSIGQTDTASSALLPGTGPHNTAPDMGRFPRKIPTFELTAHYDFFHNSPKDSQSGSCHGGGVTAALALNRWASVVADVSGCQMSLSGPNLSGDSLTYLFGPRFTYRKGDRWSFYMNMLLGGQKLTQEQIFPERIPTGDLTEWNRLDAWVRHAQITEVSEANAFAVSVGGGLDLSINRALAIRIGNIDHLWTSIGDFNNISYARGFRFSSGAVLRFGNW
jgi:hypothetical protein